MAGFATAQSSGPPVTILIGPGGDAGSASYNITSKVPVESIRVEESGNHESQTADFEILDKGLAFASMRGEWKVTIIHGQSPIFRGFIRSPRVEHEGEIYGGVAVTAYDVGTLLDRLIIDAPFRRTNSESDADRIRYLVNTFGQPLVKEGMTDWSKVQTLSASMPGQEFGATLTLRQAIERVLSASSDSANYYVDYAVRLHTFDWDHPESSNTAPYDINASTSLGANEIPPEDLVVEWDSTNLINWYYVRAKNAASSGNFNESNSNLYSLNNANSYDGTYSKDIFGTRKAYIDAPDADTASKAKKVARAALQDTRYPIPRVSFSVSADYCARAGQRWQAGQLVYITSPIHGLTGRTTDYLNYRLQPFRIVRVTTTYLAGDGTRRMDIECGGRRPHLYQATIGS